MAGSDGDPPGGDSRDERLRDGVLQATASAVVTAQRLATLAESRGLSPDDLKGTGDLIYEVITDQILLAERVIRHQHEVLERVVDRVMRSEGPQEPLILRGVKSIDFTIANTSLQSGAVEAGNELVLTGPGGAKVTWKRPDDFCFQPGRPWLGPRQRTGARLTLKKTLPSEDLPQHGRLKLYLRPAGGERVELASRDVELWSSPPSEQRGP